MMTVVQFICAKIGMATGMGLARVVRRHYSKAVLYPMVAGLVIANTINVGTDIGAIAAAVNHLVPIPVTVMIMPIGARHDEPSTSNDHCCHGRRAHRRDRRERGMGAG
jgi:Mn2+/Fe2+ NRAMP family transporter